MTSSVDSAPAPAQHTRDVEFAAHALPHLGAIARVAQALTGDPADADDLVQETFLRAYRHWNTFERGTDCRRWLSTICRNAHIEQRKREQRSTPVEDHELESLAAAHVHMTAKASGLDHMFARIDLGPALAREIRSLGPHHRNVVLLVDVEGFTYEEVADALGLPVGTVRSRLFRGRRQLQEALLAYAIDAGFSTALGRATAGDAEPSTPREG
jgi:RNA polymerase sigma-70 factor (ECF subfamily)